MAFHGYFLGTERRGACSSSKTLSAFIHHHFDFFLRSIVGARSNHGVTLDFINKIKADPKQLEILGDGTQKKSYMHIEDCTDAMMHLTEYFLEDRKKVDIYNIGSSDTIIVKEIARIASSAMRQPNIAVKFTGGVDGGRGWKGDVKTMQLSISRLVQTGWKPKYTSRQAVELTAEELATTSSR